MSPDEPISGERHAEEKQSADIERLLERLPDSYREWEQTVASEELERVRLRVEALLLRRPAD